jgi:hypothetical protein
VVLTAEVLEQKIIAYLRTRGVQVFVPLTEIVNNVFPGQRTAVNSRLYELERRKVVAKQANASSRSPQWMLINP